MAPLDRTFDDDAAGQDEEEVRDEEDTSQALAMSEVLSAIEKVCLLFSDCC
jgi:hypothetical protein